MALPACVAVSAQEPDDTSVKVEPDTVHTEVSPDVTVGVNPDVAEKVSEIVDAEYVWFPGEVNEIVWDALATLTEYVVVAVLNFPVSVGVNVAVIVAEPAPAIVTAPVPELTLATDVSEDE